MGVLTAVLAGVLLVVTPPAVVLAAEAVSEAEVGAGSSADVNGEEVISENDLRDIFVHHQEYCRKKRETVQGDSLGGYVALSKDTCIASVDHEWHVDIESRKDFPTFRDHIQKVSHSNSVFHPPPPPPPPPRCRSLRSPHFVYPKHMFILMVRWSN